MLTLDDFINRSVSVHGHKYDYSLVSFKKVIDKVKIICPKHGVFEQSARAHYRGLGCPLCAIEGRSKKRASNTEEFIEKARSIHGDQYDYSKVNYVNSKAKVTITCKEHGDFEQEPHNHLAGNGCPICANAKKGEASKCTIDEFIDKARSVHGDKYDYSEASYVNNRTLIKIICPKHGMFKQTPDVHLGGHGCPDCAKESRAEKAMLTKEDFVEKARAVHGDRYSYDKTEYKGINVPVTITCSEHGDFIQKPVNHLGGCGCQKCASLFSKYENELCDFISSLIGEENIVRNDRKTLSGYELDAYIPSKKIAFEFDGLYWHSDAKKSDDYHLKKTEKCEDIGIQLIHIFEDEWLFKNDICKSRIRSMMGLSEYSIGARKCKVVSVAYNEAKKFFNENHIQGNVNASVTLGLEYDGNIVSMMSFGSLRKNMGRTKEDGCYEMLRFCNKRDYNVAGGASKLMKHFIQAYAPEKIISYADRRWSVGNLYEKLGFNFVHNSQPNYFYVVGDKRENRFSYRKSVLVEKYGCAKEDTERNFCKKMGLNRIYDCGSKLYEWKKSVKE